MNETMKVYTHGEAFRRMLYRCNGGHSEWIWNSRDGVTPFCVDCRQCDRETMHVNWKGDIFDPFYQPKPGERFFRDGTDAEARAIVRKRCVPYEINGQQVPAPPPEEIERMVAEAPTWSEFQPGWPMLEVKEGGPCEAVRNPSL